MSEINLLRIAQTRAADKITDPAEELLTIGTYAYELLDRLLEGTDQPLAGLPIRLATDDIDETSAPLIRGLDFYKRLMRLQKYGAEGLYYEVYDPEEQPELNDVLLDDLKRVNLFLRLLPLALPIKSDGCGSVCWRIYGQAEARYRLDTGTPLPLEGVALLSGMVLKAVQNAASERLGSKRLVVRPDGHVEPRDAERWLMGRRGFVLTRFFPDTELEENDDEEDEEEGEYVFVPEAADGSRFQPEHRRSGKGYELGRRGNRLYVQDYFKALEKLARMAVPRWRRPNASGNWGTVTGVRWVRVPRRELNLNFERGDEM